MTRGTNQIRLQFFFHHLNQFHNFVSTSRKLDFSGKKIKSEEPRETFDQFEQTTKDENEIFWWEQNFEWIESNFVVLMKSSWSHKQAFGNSEVSWQVTDWSLFVSQGTDRSFQSFFLARSNNFLHFFHFSLF